MSFSCDICGKSVPSFTMICLHKSRSHQNKTHARQQAPAIQHENQPIIDDEHHIEHKDDDYISNIFPIFSEHMNLNINDMEEVN